MTQKPQLELPLIYPLKTPPRWAEPKVTPHRTGLSDAADTVAMATRAAVESPSPANLRALNDAVVKCHQSLQILQYVEKNLAAS